MAIKGMGYDNGGCPLRVGGWVQSTGRWPRDRAGSQGHFLMHVKKLGAGPHAGSQEEKA